VKRQLLLGSHVKRLRARFCGQKRPSIRKSSPKILTRFATIVRKGRMDRDRRPSPAF